MELQDDSKALAEEVLADLELGRIPLVNSAMKCSRLARLMGNEKALHWFQLEIGGYPTPLDKYSFDIGRTAGRMVAGTESDKDGPKIWTASIPSLEANMEAYRIELASLNLPSISLSEAEAQPGLFHIPGSSITGVVASVLTRRKEVLQAISTNTGVLSRVRASIYRWVLETHHVLRFGSIPADAFHTARVLVETQLRIMSADALEKFVAAQQRAVSGAPEEWSQALLSLRRMLKNLADALFPPRDGEIDGHKMDDDHYTNRLWQFVKERATSDKPAILQAEVQYVGQRIDALYELACKGTHGAVSREEVDLAVVHVYLLAADLLAMLTPQERARLGEVKKAIFLDTVSQGASPSQEG